MTGVQRRGHAGGPRGFDADDAGAGVLCGERGDRAGEQPAAADGEHEYVGRVPQLLHHLQRDRPLPGDGARVVERRHDRGAGAGGLGVHLGGGVVIRLTGDDDLDPAEAESPHAVPLLPRSGAGQVDSRVDAELGAGEGDTLRVVARARAHDAAGAFVVGELGDHVVGAADLVRAHGLQVLTLEVHLRPGERGKPRAGFEGGVRGDAGEPVGGGADVVGGRRRGGHAAHGIDRRGGTGPGVHRADRDRPTACASSRYGWRHTPGVRRTGGRRRGWHRW